MLKLFDNRKGKSGNGWLIIVAIAAALLIPQSPLNIFSIISGEQTFIWQGLVWRYNGADGRTEGENADPLVPLVSGEAIKLGISCNYPSNCNGYFKNGFDLSKFVEVGMIITANTAAQIGGNSMAASGAFSFTIDDVSYSSITSSAEERGGTQTFSDSDRTEATITLLRTDNGWDIYKNNVKVANTSKVSPTLKFLLSGGGSQQSAGGSANAEIFFRAKNSSLLTKRLLCEATKGTYLPTTSECICPSNSKGYSDDAGCNYNCLPGEVKLIDGNCKALIRTCIDNNLNNICDPDDPIVYQDPDSNAPVCADRDANRVCDDVASLFCKDENNNRLCDSDEVRWYATNCPDTNGNGICDGIESGKILCPATYAPVCDPTTNITFPNSCFASGFENNAKSCGGVAGIPCSNGETCYLDGTYPDAGGKCYAAGACKVPPVIIRLDCATGDVPIPSGYICNPETGWLIKTEKIYVDVFTDCRSLGAVEGYTCTDINGKWVFVKTEFITINYTINKTITVDCRVFPAIEGYTCKNIGNQYVFVKTEFLNIDCYSKGCPTNSLCQAGICVTSAKRCPEQVDCNIYGSDTSCDEETGLCVKSQYKTLDCGTLGCPLGSECVKADTANVCLKTKTIINQTTVFDKNPVFGKPRPISTTALIVLGVIVVGGILLAARKR